MALSRADALVLAATDRRRAKAEAILAEHPEIDADPWVALVLGRGWDGDPNTPGGPRGWAPLLYVCHSCFASVVLARELLAAGADPNVAFMGEHGRMSALYGAAGVVHDPELTGLLLEAGANPDDGESLYHATEAEDPECLRLLLAHGANPNGTNALAHALDDERLRHVRLLLDAGADPNEGALLAHAVRRGRGPDTLRLLVERGAELDRPGGETWRPNAPLRTPYQHAVLRGRADSAKLLAELGAATELRSDDAAIAAIARGERPGAEPPAELDYDAQEVVILAALRGQLDVVVDVLGPNFSGVVGGSPSGTLLQHAAWLGDAETVRELLARGADASIDSPLGWAAHGSPQHELPGRDYVAVAEALVEAGATIDGSLLELADGPLYRWLTQRGLGDR